MMKSRCHHLSLKLIVPFLFLIAFSCSNEKKSPETSPKGSAVVTAYQIKTHDVPIYFEYVAQTQSSHLVNIQARVTGFLEKRVYTEGETVKEGQVLFLMDKKPFEAQVHAAEAAVARQKAALETARLNLARVKPLSQLNALSQKDLDDATGQFETNAASLEQTKAQLETAILNLSYCTIASPIDGITSSAQQQDGTYISPNNSLLTTVTAISPIWVNFSLSESELQNYEEQVKKGQLQPPENKEYDIKVIQMNGKVFPHTGKITFTEPYFNPKTGTFLIRASVENPEGILRPNQYVRARIEGAKRPNAILVPQRAVQQSAKGPFIWIIKDGKADFRPITVGDWKGEYWFITEGLHAGEEIVVDGTVGLHPGDSLKIKEIINENAPDFIKEHLETPP
jgi:membrane fusion protein (multidrug efflux system)